jgi:hypothetical protein
MTQNLVTLNLTPEQLATVDHALTELETQLEGMIALTAQQRRALRRMGDKSEAFCRQALRVLEQNPQMVPPNVPLADAVADLNALDQLRPRMIRLARLSERAADTDVALGSDVMTVALQGYGLLKLTGRSEGLEPLRRELKARFRKSARQPQAEPDAKAQTA